MLWVGSNKLREVTARPADEEEEVKGRKEGKRGSVGGRRELRKVAPPLPTPKTHHLNVTRF